ncbi:MAG: type II secretion system protein [Planctomycetes bacterium]|nr:type II secretion system protein [Planctomycetota bacterium]
MFVNEGFLDMRKTDKNFGISRYDGFTLMELLVVIAIIMMLVGILVPGMRAIKRLSKNLQQKSLFHSIEIGVELFLKDFGDYPDSKRSEPDPPTGLLYYCGAQHLAEAMVGRDERGYEPVQSRRWYWPGDEPPSVESVNYDLYWSSKKSLDRRKITYIELKKTGAYDPGEIYDDTGQVYSDPGYSGVPEGELSLRGPVLTDVFLKKKITTTNGDNIKVGSPILYYKANRNSRLFEKAGPAIPGDTDKWIFNYKDNIDLVDLGAVGDDDPSIQHLMDETLFYETITNPGVSYEKPFNSTTFILISAGDDSVFGTKDDVTNFNY